MLYRNPALDLLGDRAVKMAGARSGVEIGEQERRFLEGWAKKEKARGVVDMVVSRFGKEVDLQLFRDGEDGGQKDASENDSGFWFWGKGGREGKRSDEKNQDQGPKVVMPEDGCVFRGIGEISTKSVIDLTNYLAELYETSDSTTLPGRTASQRRHPRRKTRRSQRASLASQFPTDGSGRKMASSDAEGAPRNSTSTVRARGESTRMAPASVPEPVSTLTPAPTSSLPPSIPNTTPPPDPPPVEETPPLAPMVDVDPQPNDTPLLSEPTTNSTQTLIATSQYASTKVMNILTFGWSGSRTNSPAPSTSSNQAPSTPGYSEPTPPRKLPSTPGRFLIGFQGDLDLEDIDDDFEASDGRITSRTVWITPANAPNEGMNEYRLVVYTVCFPPHISALFSSLWSPYLICNYFLPTVNSTHHYTLPFSSSQTHAISPRHLSTVKFTTNSPRLFKES